MTTYNFIRNHMEKDYQDAVPAMDEYLAAWIKDDEGVHISQKFSGDLSTIIYPYLAAYKALTDAGVEDAEKYIVDIRTEEVGN